MLLNKREVIIINCLNCICKVYEILESTQTLQVTEMSVAAFVNHSATYSACRMRVLFGRLNCSNDDV